MEKNSEAGILVIGGTGNQGGSVARELLKNGHTVKILTRNTESAPAIAIAKEGAELVKGDMADLSSLESAMEGVSAIFSAQWSDPEDPSIEIRNAGNMVKAASKAGIQQVVHTSLAGSNLFPRWDKYPMLVQNFDHKFEVEELIRNGGFPYWTILHPCWFMENLKEQNARYMAPELYRGVLFGAMRPDTPIKLNCGEDTANFARAAFEQPEKFHKKDINVAGDELSMAQIADVLSNVMGKKVVYQTVGHEEAVRRGLFEGTAYGNEWMDAVPGYGFELSETKGYGVLLKSFEQWVCENKEKIHIN